MKEQSLNIFILYILQTLSGAFLNYVIHALSARNLHLYLTDTFTRSAIHN